jgi:hypothetical protein
MDENKPIEKPEAEHNQPVGIKPSEEQRAQLKYFISAPLRSANRLMNQLYSDDQFYETATYAWVGEADAKKLFLYGVCKEVMKTCVGLMNDGEFLEEVPPETETDTETITKIIAGSIMDVQTYRVRKMIELLSLLILFDRNTKNDEEYRIFLNAENMDLALAQQQDFRELYEGRAISNTQHSINDFAERISQDMQKLGVPELWFLDNKKFRRQKPSVFKSKKSLYLEALLVASADERIALGISYGRGYSRTSESVHPLLGSHDYGNKDNDTKHVVSNFTHLSLICMHIMNLAYKIGGIDDPEGLTKVMGANFEKSDAPKSMASFSKEYQCGDIVLTAWTDLAEIMEEHTSRYGYKAYKIRYISKPPLPEFSEDWLEARMILARLMTKNMVRGFYEKSINSISHDKETVEVMQKVLKLPDEALLKCAEKTFLDLHNAGILIPMLLESGFLKKTAKPDL